MNKTQFTFQNLRMTDEEFWEQVQELDETTEQLTDFHGYSIKAKLPTGKDLNVPFVRFSKTISGKKS